MRSKIEIANALRAICDAGETLSASLPADDTLFLSRLLHVDPDAGSIVLAWSTTKEANLAILAAQRVTFGCSHEGAHYEFLAFAPHESDHGGEAGIQFAFPGALLVLHRRAHRRFAVPPDVQLTCEVAIGPISFDARVVDISLNGIGAITYDAGIRLEPGMLLQRTRILPPRELPVIADLEVRHVSNFVLPDGRAAHRAGCRLIGNPGEIERLIRNFVTALNS